MVTAILDNIPKVRLCSRSCRGLSCVGQQQMHQGLISNYDLGTHLKHPPSLAKAQIEQYTIISTTVMSIYNKPTQAAIEIGSIIVQINDSMIVSLPMSKRPNHWSHGILTDAEA